MSAITNTILISRRLSRVGYDDNTPVVDIDELEGLSRAEAISFAGEVLAAGHDVPHMVLRIDGAQNSHGISVDIDTLTVIQHENANRAFVSVVIDAERTKMPNHPLGQDFLDQQTAIHLENTLQNELAHSDPWSQELVTVDVLVVLNEPAS